MTPPPSSATAMFPLQSAPLPGDTLPLRIFEPRYSQLVVDTLAAHAGGGDEPSFGVVLINRGREVGGGDVRADIGAMAQIASYADLGMGQYELLARVGPRLRVLQWLPDDPYPRATVEFWPDEPGPPVTPARIGEVVDRIIALYQLVADAGGGRLQPDALAVDAETADDPARHLYALAARVPLGPADRYALLSAPSLAERVDVLLEAIDTVAAMVTFQLSGESDE